MMKNLVIGGAGFIGSNLCNHLLSNGQEVSVLDNFSRKGTEFNFAWVKKNHPKVSLIRADIRNPSKELGKAVAWADNIYHLAAQVAVTTSVTDPRTDFEINALGTFNVLEAMRSANNGSFLVFSSTNKVYGDLEHMKTQEDETKYFFSESKNGVSEKTNLDFHSPYGCSKGAADQYVRDYSRIYGLDTVVMRQSCIYGPRQFGVEDQGWVAWFTIAALLGKKITIYGNGKQVRDLLHVQDLVNAFLLAPKNRKKSSGQVFNIGGGAKNALSLLEFLEILENKLGRKISKSFDNIRPGDQKIFVSDNSKILSELGWKPQINIHDGLSGFFDWVKANQAEIKQVLG